MNYDLDNTLILQFTLFQCQHRTRGVICHLFFLLIQLFDLCTIILLREARIYTNSMSKLLYNH
jgi:hypothetical protein